MCTTLVPCAHSERTIFVDPSSLLPAHEDDDLVMRSALQLSTVRVESLPMGMQRPAALNDFFVFAVGVSRTLLKHLLGRWALALTFRLKVFTSLEGLSMQPPLCLRSRDERRPA